jgi:hypothetical protein
MKNLIFAFSRGLQVKGQIITLSEEVENMRHQLKISVSNKPQTGGIVRCRNVTLRERFLRRILGEKQKLMILIPGDSVESLCIKEIDKKGEMENEQKQTAAGCCSEPD